MIPDKLGAGDEREVLKLAYDIGTALKKAHDKIYYIEMLN